MFKIESSSIYRKLCEMFVLFISWR